MGDVTHLIRQPVSQTHACLNCEGTNFKLWTDGEIHCSHCETILEGLTVIVDEEDAS